MKGRPRKLLSVVTQYFHSLLDIPLGERHCVFHMTVGRLKVLCFGLASGAIAPLFFGGGWVESLASFILGLMVGVGRLTA